MSPAVALSDLSAVVLAAGLSRRAAPHNKLLFPFGGDTVVRATVHAFCGAGLGEVLVVTGHQREPVEAALAGLPVRIVFAEDFAAGHGERYVVDRMHLALAAAEPAAAVAQQA